MNRRPKPRRYYLPWGCLAAPILLAALGAALLLTVPLAAAQKYGAASPRLGVWQRFQSALALLWQGEGLQTPLNPQGGEQPFVVQEGEGAAQVALRLQSDGLIADSGAFRAYLVYAGLDTGIQAGEFLLSPALSPLQIAQALQDATPSQIRFTVLSGWRVEEIAQSLPTSGFAIAPEEFLQAAANPPAGLDFLPSGAGAEGFLLPGAYTLPREMDAPGLVDFLLKQAALALTPELRAGFARQNLSVYQAVTLASIVQREAVQTAEQPTIASVFLNRLAAGIRLETDPTVQYALGYYPPNQTWWKAPLALEDLSIPSPYNTYQIPGLPPAPISNPSLSALHAVAYPAQTPYYFFRARCDGSGLHAFAETYEEHLQNACP